MPDRRRAYLGLPEARSRDASVLALLMFVSLSSCGECGAMVGNKAFGPYMAVIMMGAVLAARWLVGSYYRRTSTPLVRFATAAAAVGNAALLSGLFWSALGAQIDAYSSRTALLRYIGGALAMSLPVVIAAGVFAGVLLHRYARRTLLAGGARAVAVVATGVLALLVAASGIRAARMPSIDRYLSELERIGQIPPLEGIWPANYHPANSLPCEGGHPAAGDHQGLAGELVVRRTCDDRGSCRVGLSEAGRAADALEVVAQDAPTVRWCNALALLRDRRTGLVLLSMGSDDPSLGTPVRAVGWFRYDGARWRPANLPPGDLAQRASAPHPWIAGGVLGLLLAAVGWARRLRAARRGRALATARVGVLGRDGWISFGGEVTVRVDPELGLPEGHVLVMEGTSTGTPYRHGLRPGRNEVVPGTHSEHAEAVARELLDDDAAVSAVALLAAAPLVAAAVAGLVW